MAPSLPSTGTSTPASSSASTMAVSPSPPVYGVAPPDIASLPHVCPRTSRLQPSHDSHLHPSSSPSTTTRAPVPLLSLAEFGRMRLEQATVHPPDSVLFPFLHGLEGDNDPQCAFFASTPSTAASAAAGLVQDSAGRVIRPPRYRGLVWVLCDEDIQGDLPQICTAPTRWEDDLACDSDSSDYSTDQAEPDLDLEFDAPAAEPSQHSRQLHPAVPPLAQPDPCAMDVDTPPNPSEEPQMHPLALRIATSNNLHHLSHDRRHSDSSSSDSASSDGSSSTNSGSGSTSATSLPSPLFPPNPSCAAYPNMCEEGHLLLDAHNGRITSDSHSEAQHIQDLPKPTCPPILTSTFLPSQLIQPCQSAPDNFPLRTDDWLESTNCEFKPAIVPDGISLRNFGIQVPLYTSISDIVVYSPRGPSPAALRLAARFRRAVEKKRSERLDKWVRMRGESARSEKEDAYITPEGFLKYGVYVLDADADAIRREIPWMIMQREGECDKTCANGTFPQVEGRYTPSGCSGRCTSTLGGSWRSEHARESDPPVKQTREPEIEPEVLATESAVQVPEEPLSPPRPTYTRSRSHTHPYHPRDGQRSHRERPTTDTVQSPVSGSTCTPPLPRPTVMHQDPTSTPVNHHSCVLSPFGHHHELHRCKRTNTIDFARREKEEMRDLTRASEIITVWGVGDESDHVHSSKATPATCWDPHAGQVFLGNSNDVPVWTPPSKKKRRAANSHTNPSIFPRNHHRHHESFMNSLERPSPFESEANSPSLGRGFDICIECHEYAPLPSTAHLRAVEEHVRTLEMEWVEQCQRAAANRGENMDVDKDKIPPRPPPHPSAVVHLPFPSSQQAMPSMLSSLIHLIRFLEKLITPSRLGGGDHAIGIRTGTPGTPSKGSRLPSFPWSHGNGHENGGSVHANGHGNGNGNGYGIPMLPPAHRPRPLKLLLYSSDGYTESSVPALCLLMAVKGLSLPEVYLEMQVVKRRSFFVYQAELALLKRVEARLGVSSGQGHSRLHAFGYRDIPRGLAAPPGPFMTVPTEDPNFGSNLCLRPLVLHAPPSSVPSGMRGATTPIAHRSTSPSMLDVRAEEEVKLPSQSLLRRPRASTLPSFIPDHQSWFDDARFDGSFPSRVLPFLYLGNLNHASNAYMLHALGITHVVSVGECALVPPPQMSSTAGDVAPACPIQWSRGAQCVAGQGPSSLWIEEHEGRIKVLNIEGVCDDGIDTLEHQLHPICTWIEKARQAGGQVLVHCRVGVSRSATVTIAYVMQHLGLSLVEAYLVVRSRRLSVLIQPNMRLLYNLLGWEVRLARERAAGDERRLREELTKALSWPYLAREVHALNEKYLGSP